MSEQAKHEIAKEYVDKQLEIMRSYEAAPSHLSNEEYEGMIEEAAGLVQA